MRLNVTRMGSADFGQYKCYAKNGMGLMFGDFHVHETDPRLATPPPLQGRGAVATFGTQQPKLEAEEDLCPPQPQCPQCPPARDVKNVTELRCRDSKHDWALNLEVGDFVRPNRTGSWPGYPRERPLSECSQCSSLRNYLYTPRLRNFQ